MEENRRGNSTVAIPNTYSSRRWYFSASELENSPSRKCGISAEKELLYRQQSASFIQDTGQHLKVNQLCMNTAIVFMHRFYMHHSFSHFHRKDICPAAVYLAAKVEEQPRKIQDVITAAHFCLFRDKQPPLDLTSAKYLELSTNMITNENVLLQTLGFEMTIYHPHTYVVRCCQLVRASRELTQASYFVATQSHHLTTFCIQYCPKLVAGVCIFIACKWSNYEIPHSKEGKTWYSYVDDTITIEQLETVSAEFLTIFKKSPTVLNNATVYLKQMSKAINFNVALPMSFKNSENPTETPKTLPASSTTQNKSEDSIDAEKLTEESPKFSMVSSDREIIAHVTKYKVQPINTVVPANGHIKGHVVNATNINASHALGRDPTSISSFKKVMPHLVNDKIVVHKNPGIAHFQNIQPDFFIKELNPKTVISTPVAHIPKIHTNIFATDKEIKKHPSSDSLKNKEPNQSQMKPKPNVEIPISKPVVEMSKNHPSRTAADNEVKKYPISDSGKNKEPNQSQVKPKPNVEIPISKPVVEVPKNHSSKSEVHKEIVKYPIWGSGIYKEPNQSKIKQTPNPVLSIPNPVAEISKKHSSRSVSDKQGETYPISDSVKNKDRKENSLSPAKASNHHHNFKDDFLYRRVYAKDEHDNQRPHVTGQFDTRHQRGQSLNEERQKSYSPRREINDKYCDDHSMYHERYSHSSSHNEKYSSSSEYRKDAASDEYFEYYRRRRNYSEGKSPSRTHSSYCDNDRTSDRNTYHPHQSCTSEYGYDSVSCSRSSFISQRDVSQKVSRYPEGYTKDRYQNKTPQKKTNCDYKYKYRHSEEKMDKVPCKRSRSRDRDSNTSKNKKMLKESDAKSTDSDSTSTSTKSRPERPSSADKNSPPRNDFQKDKLSSPSSSKQFQSRELKIKASPFTLPPTKESSPMLASLIRSVKRKLSAEKSQNPPSIPPGPSSK